MHRTESFYFNLLGWIKVKKFHQIKVFKHFCKIHTLRGPNFTEHFLIHTYFPKSGKKDFQIKTCESPFCWTGKKKDIKKIIIHHFLLFFSVMDRAVIFNWHWIFNELVSFHLEFFFPNFGKCDSWKVIWRNGPLQPFSSRDMSIYL